MAVSLSGDDCLPNLPSPNSLLRRFSMVPAILAVLISLWIGLTFIHLLVFDKYELFSIYSKSNRVLILIGFLILYLIFWWSYYAVMFTSPGYPPNSSFSLIQRDVNNPNSNSFLVEVLDNSSTNDTPKSLPFLDTHNDLDFIPLQNVNSNQSSSSQNNPTSEVNFIDEQTYNFTEKTILSQLGIVIPFMVPISRPINNHNGATGTPPHIDSYIINKWETTAIYAARQYIANLYGVQVLNALLDTEMEKVTDLENQSYSTQNLMEELRITELSPKQFKKAYLTDSILSRACGIPEDSSKLRFKDFVNIYRDTNKNLEKNQIQLRNIFQESKIMFLTFPIECKRNDSARYCKKCDTWKPDRTHHCSTCNQCVLKMDHHCPWINNCVGFKNYKLFLLFIFYTLLITVYVSIFMAHVLFVNGDGPSGNIEISASMEFSIYMISLLSATFAVCMVIFVGIHFRYVIVNSTTIESMELGILIRKNAVEAAIKSVDYVHSNLNSNFKSSNITSVKDNQGDEDDFGPFNYRSTIEKALLAKENSNIISCESINMYDCGFKNNWFQIFGSNKSDWLIPKIADDIGDGIVYPVSINQLKKLL